MFTRAALVAAAISATASAAPTHNMTAAPTATAPATSTPIGGDGCATLSQYIEENPKATAYPASLGYNCLASVPVDQDGDAKQISEIYNIMRWQSTLAYLKDPPEGYPNSPVDILGGLDDIANKLSEGGYSNEYDVQNEISVLLGKAYDGHTGFVSDIASTIGFQKVLGDSESGYRGASLVSVSSDGVELPKVFFLEDIVKAKKQSNFTPSAITTINNQSTEDYLSWLADQDYGEHDPDARYQNLFFNPAGYSSSGRAEDTFTLLNIYEGDATIVGHEDGSTTVIQNVVSINGNFSGVDSGEAFFETFCRGPTTTTTGTDEPTPEPTSSPEPLPTAYGYPYPVQKAGDNSVSGYFLNEIGYQDVAVISTATFGAESITEYQDVVTNFLADAVAADKKHLIVDLRHNGGGKIVLGFDLFKQLFPSEDPYGASRIRAFDTFDAIGQVTSAQADALASNETALEEFLNELPSSSATDYWYSTAGQHSDDDPFTSWADLYGPASLHGDNFTELIRHNWSDPRAVGDFNLGNLNATSSNKPPAQPFKAENIILLQDGYCASTCTIFSELMKTQGHVKQVVIGGRPHNGPMIAIGGTKGSQVLSWDVVVANGASAVKAASSSDDDDDDDDGSSDSLQLLRLDDAGVTALANSTHALARAAPGDDGVRASLNYRNQYRQGDGDDMPLQFVRDYADCRLWYTPPMIFSPVAVWNSVFDVVWRNGSCVAGSTGYAG